MELITTMLAVGKFSFAEEIIKRKDWVKYKTIPEWHGRLIDENVLIGRPGEQFQKAIDTHVNAYIFNKKEPPVEIAGAIINIADDFLNGREPVMKSGDYISVQNFVRKGMKKA